METKGESIYPIGSMCDYKGCRDKGKMFEINDTLIWICKKHQELILEKIFPEIKSS